MNNQRDTDKIIADKLRKSINSMPPQEYEQGAWENFKVANAAHIKVRRVRNIRIFSYSTIAAAAMLLVGLFLFNSDSLNSNLSKSVLENSIAVIESPVSVIKSPISVIKSPVITVKQPTLAVQTPTAIGQRRVIKSVGPALLTEQKEATKEARTIKETQAINEAKKIKENAIAAQAIEETQAINEAKKIKENAIAKQAIEETQAINEALANNETSAINETLSNNETSAINETLSNNETSAINEISVNNEALAIKEKEVFKENKRIFESDSKATDKRLLQFGVNVAPGFNSTSSSSGSTFNYSGGVSLDIAIAKNLQISTGVQIEHQNVGGDAKMKASEMVPGHVDAVLTNLDIPINITWHFFSDKSRSYYVSGGFSSLAYLNEKYTTTSYSHQIRANTLDSSEEPLTTYKIENVESVRTTTFAPSNAFDMAGRVNIIFGFEQKLSPKLNVHIEPFIKVPLTGLASENMRFTTGGVTFKVSF